MRQAILQSNFTAGEISPRLKGRVDFDKYFNTAETLKNVIVQTHGGVFRRTGTRFVAEVKNSAKKVRLIRFEFSLTQAYILEFGDQYMRVFKDQGQVTSGGSPYEISTPYLEADLFEIQFVQSADVLYLAHPSYKPRKISRTGHTAWTLSNFTPTSDPFGADGSDNCPAAVAFYEERLWWGGTNNDPQKLFASKTGDYEDYTETPVADDMSLRYTIASGDVSSIRWLSSGKVLAVGTLSGEYIVRASALNEPVTPTNVRITLETTYGCQQVKPVKVDTSVLFVQREGHKVREFKYIFENDSYTGKDLSILSEHLSNKTVIKQIEYQKTRNQITWCVTDTGQLLSMTFSPNDDVIAWSQHILGGTDSEVESVSIIPGSEGQDEVWVSVKRTINGSTKRYIEYISKDYYPLTTQDKDGAIFVDSSLEYNGTSTTTISGLSHLEGETVSILADGAVQPSKTVSSGGITLSKAATKVQVGLAYTSVVQTVDYEGGVASGTSQTHLKRIIALGIRFHESLGCEYGPTESNTDPAMLRPSSSPMGSSPPLFTGDKVLNFPSGWDRQSQAVVLQNDPLPMNILALILYADTGDR